MVENFIWRTILLRGVRYSGMTKILVVDDEQDLCEILRFNLSNEGFAVATANSAEEALELMAAEGRGSFALILLDVMMERMSGFEMARQLREKGDETPIIFLTALGEHDDQMKGFENGADDYIAKPFSFDTVLARIKAVLKRTQGTRTSGANLSVGGIAIDTAQQKVTVGGKTVELTRREYLILGLLAQSPNRYFSREEIMTRVWPEDALVNDRSVDVHIARLRKKLESEGSRIVNRTGFGYMLNG